MIEVGRREGNFGSDPVGAPEAWGGGMRTGIIGLAGLLFNDGGSGKIARRIKCLLHKQNQLLKAGCDTAFVKSQPWGDRDRQSNGAYKPASLVK